MAETANIVKGEPSAAERRRFNLRVGLRAIKHGVPVLALGRGKEPIVKAFPRLDVEIPKEEREEICEVFQAERGFAPLGIGSTLRDGHVRMWERDATTTEFAIGISPGLCGAVVVDCDDIGGALFLAYMAAQGEVIDYSRTPVTVTGSGGLHFWFANPDRIGCGRFPQLKADLKGVGGQCVAPGCIIGPKRGEDGKPTGGPRRYIPLDGTPDLFETIKAGLLPPYPESLKGLKPEATERRENDGDIRAALETLAAGPPADKAPRDVLAMVAEVKGPDQAFAALWDTPSPDHSDNRWKAARAMLTVYGPAQFDVHDLADVYAGWEGAGAYVERKGDARGTYGDRDIAREWAKNSDVPRVVTGDALTAARPIADVLAALRDADMLGLDLDDTAAELTSALWMADAPEATIMEAQRHVEAVRAGQADAMAQLAVIVETHGGKAVEVDPAATEPAPKPRKAAAVYLADLMAEPPEPLEQLVKGVLTAAEIAVAAGAPGAGKTTGMQHLGLCVSAGADFHGRKTKQGGTLYVGTENRGEDERRLRANLKRHGRDDRLPFRFLPRGVKLYDEQARPTMDEREVIKLALEMERDTGHRCKLIVVDNLRRVIAPGSTSDEANVTVVMKALERIRDATGAAVVIIHHNVRAESRYSGSGAIESHADSVWQFGPAKKGKAHAITFEKLRLGDKRQELPFTFGFEVVAHDSDGDDIRTVVAVDVDTSASALGPVEDDDAPTLEAAVVAPEVADGMPERVEMMGQAARDISTTRERFSAKELYAATNGVRLALGLAELKATTLDMVREALIGSGALRVEGFGRARSYSTT